MANIPPYASFEAPRKFEAIKTIIAKRLIEHPKAVCSYSGGADSDIMLDLIEKVRGIYGLPPVKYVFYNTGLEMEATKRHVKEQAEKYGIEIETVRPKIGIVQATRKYGLPIFTKRFSEELSTMQKHNMPLSIVDEFNSAEDKKGEYEELIQKYPISVVQFLCSCNEKGEYGVNQCSISSAPYLVDFIKENPIPFQVSGKCCDYCKKQPAHQFEKNFEMAITGERKAEGGVRSMGNKSCFDETANGKFRLRPLYYVSDKDKAWYKEYYNLRYSDAYEVYGFKRTGCCGCSINAKAVTDLERLKPFEPKIYKAAWNIFGESYRYRQKYKEYVRIRRAKDKECEGQINLFEEMIKWN